MNKRVVLRKKPSNIAYDTGYDDALSYAIDTLEVKWAAQYMTMAEIMSSKHKRIYELREINAMLHREHQEMQDTLLEVEARVRVLENFKEYADDQNKDQD